MCAKMCEVMQRYANVCEDVHVEICDDMQTLARLCEDMQEMLDMTPRFAKM